MGKRAKGIIIAIDGPAGVGKSTVGRMVAASLGYSFISTGKMYRALAWKALAAGADLEDEAALMRLASAARWELKPSDSPEPQLCLDGTPLDREITDETVAKASSSVSKFAGVRGFMRDMQRGIGAEGGVVMEGRDIGTNVFPDAAVKVYLTARPEVRAARRAAELHANGDDVDVEEVLEALMERDRRDSARAVAPLRKAADAVELDTSQLTLEQVVDELVAIVRSRTGAR